MKVLLLSTYYGYPTLPDAGYGGMEKVNWFLARELAKMGHEVTLVGCGGTVPPSNVEFWRYPNFPAPTIKERMEQFATEIARTSKWDIIHDSSHDHWTAKALRGKLKSRTVCTFHNPNKRDGAPNPVVLSQFHKSAPGCEYGNARVVYNGVPGDYYSYWPVKQRFVTCIAVMAHYKGVLESVEAAVEADMPIHLAGNRHDMEYWSKIEPYVDGERVVWHGEVKGKEKARLIGRAMAVMLYVKWPEPGSLVGPEAMAYGTAIIGSDQGCIPEYIEEGKTGTVCKVADGKPALVNALNWVHTVFPPDCYNRWNERYTARRMAEDYVKVYEEVLGGTTW